MTKEELLQIKLNKLDSVNANLDEEYNEVITLIDIFYDLMKKRKDTDDKYIIKNNINCLNKKLLLLNVKFDKIRVIKKILRDELVLEKSIVKLYDGDIYIVKDDEELDGVYKIYNNNKRVVGRITYTSKDFDTDFGSVGYYVNKNYRGNNYAYKALVLLANYLKKNNVSQISISSMSDNLPSLKTIKRFSKEVTFGKTSKVDNKNVKKYTYSLGKIGEDNEK